MYEVTLEVVTLNGNKQSYEAYLDGDDIRRILACIENERPFQLPTPNGGVFFASTFVKSATFELKVGAEVEV